MEHIISVLRSKMASLCREWDLLEREAIKHDGEIEFTRWVDLLGNNLAKINTYYRYIQELEDGTMTETDVFLAKLSDD